MTQHQLIKMLERIAALEAELADIKRRWEKSERWRKAYQDGKSKLYAMEGAIAEAAMECLPCNEAQMDQWFRQEYVHRDALDNANKELAAERARLDYIEREAYCLSFNVDPTQIIWGDGVITTRSLREEIDAAMKEGK